MSKPSWEPEKRLCEVANLAWPDVLRDVFLIEPGLAVANGGANMSLARLADLSGLPLDEVVRLIERNIELATEIEISCKALQTELASAGSDVVLLDVRQPWEYAICALPNSIFLCQADFPALLPSLERARRIVTICHHGVRSHSAALYFRAEGLAQTCSLAGGVEAWATEIDPSMPRY